MKRRVLILIIIILSIGSQDALAFWGSGDKDNPSGLNVTTGFDINTITTVNGVVLSPPSRKDTQEPAVLSLATTQGTVKIVIGPWWYWEQQKITIANDQKITVVGSRAQGKDGSLYIFAQRIENLSDGKTITLRSEAGVPLWSREGSGNMDGNRRQGGRQPSGSGGYGNGMRGGRR